jgi:two-component system CheB/CheR fusion protein
MFGQGTPSIMRGTKGLGIGLAMVKQIVELHNGQVEAASAGSNKGARFTVRLPLDKRQAERGDGVPETIERPLEGVRVLLVDDSQDVLEIFHQLLEMTGASVQGTTSPHEALQWLAGQRFDLLVSDIGMPEMDGFTLIQAVRALESGRDLRAIAVTGYGRQADVERALQTGFDSHINKPVDIDQVVAVALELLRRS